MRSLVAVLLTMALVLLVSCSKSNQTLVGPDDPEPTPVQVQIGTKIVGAWELVTVTEPPSWLSDVRQVYEINDDDTRHDPDEIIDRELGAARRLGHDRLVFEPAYVLKTRYDPIGTWSLSGYDLILRIMGLTITGTVDIDGDFLTISVHKDMVNSTVKTAENIGILKSFDYFEQLAFDTAFRSGDTVKILLARDEIDDSYIRLDPNDPTPTGVVIYKSYSANFRVGATLGLQATLVNASGWAVSGGGIIWSTADPSIAIIESTVGNSVTVKGVSPGTTYVIATYGDFEDRAYIVVDNIP